VHCACRSPCGPQASAVALGDFLARLGAHVRYRALPPGPGGVFLDHRCLLRKAAATHAPTPRGIAAQLFRASTPRSILPEFTGALRMLRALVVVILLILLPAHARAEAKIALLIGNKAYDPSVGVLKNPHNDIAVVGEALSKQGFEVMPPIRDARRSVMLGGVRELVRRLNAAGGGAIGFIYYSGHGAAEKETNINYLIPVDAKEPGTTMFWDDSLKLDDVLRLLDGARSAAKFIVFDACRNELQLPTKDTTKGLVPVAEQQGMFIAYASAPGRTASDIGEKSGPYAAALAAELAHPGLDHLNLFQNVKEAVLAATGGAQQPWESNGLGRRIYLTGQPKPVTSAPQSSSSTAELEWQQYGKDKKDVRLLEAFKEKHRSDPVYARLAEARIEELKKHQEVAIAAPPPRPTSVVVPPDTKCRVWTASYGGQKPLIIRSIMDKIVNYTVLDVDDGAETREVEAFIQAYAKDGAVVGVFGSHSQAMDKAWELCPPVPVNKRERTP
jgi:Caspase domain